MLGIPRLWDLVCRFHDWDGELKLSIDAAASVLSIAMCVTIYLEAVIAPLVGNPPLDAKINITPGKLLVWMNGGFVGQMMMCLMCNEVKQGEIELDEMVKLAHVCRCPHPSTQSSLPMCAAAHTPAHSRAWTVGTQLHPAFQAPSRHLPGTFQAPSRHLPHAIRTPCGPAHIPGWQEHTTKCHALRSRVLKKHAMKERKTEKGKKQKAQEAREPAVAAPPAVAVAPEADAKSAAECSSQSPDESPTDSEPSPSSSSSDGCEGQPSEAADDEAPDDEAADEETRESGSGSEMKQLRVERGRVEEAAAAEEEGDDDDLQSCVVCLDATKSHAIVPCENCGGR